MDLWIEIVTTALIGTERRPLALSPPDDSLGEALGRLDDSDPERALLAAAAITALHRCAGRLPAADRRPPPDACEMEDLPRCSPRAGQHLALMLSGQHTEVLTEWLEAAAAAGQRVPEEILPPLLDVGRSRVGIRAKVLPVLGKRGRWLAGQNPDWAYAVGVEDEADWQTARSEARLALLRRLRADDPDRARELLSTTWGQESAKERAAFLSALEMGLSIADELFLEQQLDDRSKTVRHVAADLLARLPESRLCQRMIGRVTPLLALEQKRKAGLLPRLSQGHEPKLSVTLPEACDEEMIRDGVESKPLRDLPPKPSEGMGERAWWMSRMLGAVPPAVWNRAWDRTPAQLVQAACQSEWRAVLLPGWALAAERHRDADWAEALLRVVSDQGVHVDGGKLFQSLPFDRREALVLSRLESGRIKLHQDPLAQQWLQACRHLWSPQLTRAVLDHVRRAMNVKDVNWELRQALKTFARYMSPALVDAVADLATAAREKSGWAEATEECLALLQFRQDMLKEFAQ